MENFTIQKKDFSNEFIFYTSRSSGPGGQNVNKLNTKVELHFNIQDSVLLSDTEKSLILKKLNKKITSRGDLIIVSQANRSQIKNKENVIKRFYELINKALAPEKKRIKTNPTKVSVEKRLQIKKVMAEKKELRKKSNFDEL